MQGAGRSRSCPGWGPHLQDAERWGWREKSGTRLSAELGVGGRPLGRCRAALGTGEVSGRGARSGDWTPKCETQILRLDPENGPNGLGKGRPLLVTRDQARPRGVP